MFIFCKDNKKDDTMRDRNVKMWMNFSFLDRNVSDNEMDKKNGEYIKSGCGIDEKVLLKFWYIYVSKFEETFICKREIDALPPIIRFAVFILLTEPSRIPLFNLLAIELLMAE